MTLPEALAAAAMEGKNVLWNSMRPYIAMVFSHHTMWL